MSKAAWESIGCEFIRHDEAPHLEAYLPIAGIDRLSAFFDEDEHLIVVLIVFGYRLALPHVTTIEQYQALYTALTGRGF